MIPVHKCFNLLVHNVFWAMREELKEDRFEGGLTEEEKHWASTKSAIRKEFRLSDAYTKSLETMDRVVSIDDYWGAIRWMESLVGEAHRDELLRLIDGLLEPLSPKWAIFRLANKVWSVKGVYELYREKSVKKKA